MSTITKKEAAEVAALARLALSPDECQALAGDLGAVLEHMACLDELDTTDVVPMTHASDLTLRLRPDDVDESLDPDDALDAAPVTSDGRFKVPAAILGK